MNDEMQDMGLPPAVAEHLDQWLAKWRQQRQLDPYTAGVIRQAVLAQGEVLPAQWWREHREQMNGLIAQSRRLAHELASAGLALAKAPPVSRWRAAQPVYASGRQAYLRLG